MNFKRIILLCFSIILILSSSVQAASGFDHSLWDQFLKKFVNEKGEVNYKGASEDPALLTDYWSRIVAADLKAFSEQFSREEMIAFWLNVYHAALIRLVIQHYPVSSVQKIPSFWEITEIHFGSEEVGLLRLSLNDIRIKHLMGIYHDERFHLLLSLASRDGPRLPRDAFTGPKVQGQIFLLTRRFVNDPKFVDIFSNRKKIFISPIFKWYGKDFKLDFGVPEPLGNFSVTETAVLSFLAYYLEDESKIEYLQGANYKIEYPAFDWSLNDWRPEQV